MRFSWKPSRMFYGWWIVSASFLIALCVGGVIIYGFTAIFEPIANEFGWSYAQISLAASLRGLEIALLAPVMGMLTDRWGPRRIIFCGAVITAAGLILLSRVTSLGIFYGGFALVAIGTSTCSMTVLMTAVANWFRKNVGIANGIVSCGFGFGGLLIPIIVILIDMYEWRMTVTILAFGLLAIVMPLSLLLRHKPEQYGYRPDGEVNGMITVDNDRARSPTVEINITAKQALNNSTFWRITLAYTCHVIVLSAVIMHIMPYLGSIGVARSRSGLVATAIPVISIGGRLGFGWLGDKLNRKRVVAIVFAMIVLGMLCLGYAATRGLWLLVPFLILFGIGFGGNNALSPSLVRDFFGKGNFGAIFGLIMGISSLGAIIGPPLAGWVFDNWGSYQGIWFVFAGLAFAGLILVSTITYLVYNPYNQLCH